MTEKELLHQLNKLQAIQPVPEWKDTNRQVLLAQLARGEAIASLNWLARTNVFMHRLFQPYAVAIMIVLFFAASGVAGWYASAQTKPGDPLYIAKRLSERAKQVITFDDKSKTKLNLEFASNRAKEIGQLESEQNQTEAVKDGLKSEFKNEISQARQRLARIIKPAAEPQQSDEFTNADLGKDGTRIDISVPDKVKASSTPADNGGQGIGEVLEEVQKLFDNQDYNKVVDKLDEANKLLEAGK